MRRLLLVLGLLASSCGGEDGAEGPCAAPQGTYRGTFEELSGDCGPLDSQIVTMNGATGLPPGCTGPGVQVSPDGCRMTFDYTCPGAQGYRVTQRGWLDWNADASHGEGEFQAVIVRDADGMRMCSSVYRETERRM